VLNTNSSLKIKKNSQQLNLYISVTRSVFNLCFVVTLLISCLLSVCMISLQYFDTVGWVAGRNLACKKLNGGVLTCLSVWIEVQTCHFHSLSLVSVKSRLVLPFWYQLNRVVPNKGPLNGCECVSLLHDYLYPHYRLLIRVIPPRINLL